MVHATVRRHQSCALNVSHRDVLYVKGFRLSEETGELKCAEVDQRLMDGGKRDGSRQPSCAVGERGCAGLFREPWDDVEVAALPRRSHAPCRRQGPRSCSVEL